MTENVLWQPIETAPISDKKMFVAIAINVLVHKRNYTSDPYCVWREKNRITKKIEFVRWPHANFQPTHWIPLPNPSQRIENEPVTNAI